MTVKISLDLAFEFKINYLRLDIFSELHAYVEKLVFGNFLKDKLKI